MKRKIIYSLLTLSMAVIMLSFTEDKQRSDLSVAVPQARQEYIEVEPGVRLHITDLGQGKTVVLIHGYPLSDASWEYQYQALIKAGYRVLGITLRGFGQSDKPFGKYNYDQFAADIKVVLDKLQIKDAFIGGHSMGGAIAMHYVAKYGAAHVTGLGLFSAAAPSHTKKPDFDYPFFTTNDITQWVELNNNDRPGLLAAVGERFTLTPTSVSPGIGGWLYGIELQSSPYAMEQALIALRDEDLRPDLPKIKIPTLIMHAREDKIVAYALAEFMNKQIAGSELITFDKSGHASFIEEKDKFNEELISFLKKQR